jgi:hypothetical protein
MLERKRKFFSFPFQLLFFHLGNIKFSTPLEMEIGFAGLSFSFPAVTPFDIRGGQNEMKRLDFIFTPYWY